MNANATPSTLSDFGGTGGVTHDGAGNTLSVPSSVTGVTALTGTNTYTLDSLNRLTAESSTRDGGYSEANVFDGAGNPTTLRGTSGLSYNADNQLSTDTFDGNGSPTTYKSVTATYDSDDQLTSYGSALTAGYDAFGMRAWKQNASSVRTYFLYDGARPVCELNSSGTVTAVNTFGANGLISRATISGGTPTPTYYTFDTTGSVAQRTDSSGAVTSSDLYDSFGVGLSPPPDPFGFGAQFGYYTDSETGLILCGQRYYDPATARWLTRDPIGYAGGMDLYAYCGNGPIGKADPSGYCGGFASAILKISRWEDDTLFQGDFGQAGDEIDADPGHAYLDLATGGSEGNGPWRCRSARRQPRDCQDRGDRGY